MDLGVFCGQLGLNNLCNWNGKMNTQILRQLHDDEKQEPYAEYYYRISAAVPPNVIQAIKKSPFPSEEALLFDEKNALLDTGYLSLENGYCHMPDGSVFVAVLTEMPRVTGEMLDWWFWWHPIHPLRYKIWYPEAHISTTLDVDVGSYRKRQGPYCRRYWNTTNYPLEDIGVGRDQLSITFIPPKDFGFDASRFDEANVATAICGIVGSVSKKVKRHTDMCHFVRRKASGGVEMRSRFWIGRSILIAGLSEKSTINRIVNKKLSKKTFIAQEGRIRHGDALRPRI